MKKHSVIYTLEFEDIEGENEQEVLEETNNLLKLMIEGEQDILNVFKVQVKKVLE